MMGGVQPSQSHITESPMVLFFSGYYPVGAYGGSLFGVSDVDGKGVVGPSTTQLFSQKSYCCIDGCNFVLSWSSDYS